MFSDKNDIKEIFLKKLRDTVGKNLEEATNKDAFIVLSLMLKEYISSSWIKTNHNYHQGGTKQLYYFSIEFLIGKLLYSNLLSLGVLESCQESLKELGFELEDICKVEVEAGLGNGGLGRLAACFLDSLASLQLPGHGCGLRYQYGLFKQKIIDGHQVEMPDYWLKDGYIWENKRDISFEVKFGGEVDVIEDGSRLIFKHKNCEVVKGVPYDIAILGYHNRTVNTLRLWSAEVSDELVSNINDSTDDRRALLDYKRKVEAITEFLYPDDSNYEGRLLRLKQQYFLCSAALQSILRTFEQNNFDYQELPDTIALHINDTHPAILIPELMRILMDEKGLGWNEAWDLTTRTVSFTNHTLMVEALEKWPVDMMKGLLPRIFMIINEINERFCRELWEVYPGNFEKIEKMAIIADGQIKMAHLAVVGSHSVNGVAELHSKILKEKELNDFHIFYPGKFNNKTNGITHRRWLVQSNPDLAELVTETLGHSWVYNPVQLQDLIKYQDDSAFQERIAEIKDKNKLKLSKIIKELTDISVDTDSLFDIHVKRIHGYKRQLLNVFHIIYLYNNLKKNPKFIFRPRTFIFGGRAAASYYHAKKIIKLINSVANLINNDSDINHLLKVVFIPNYSVSLAEKIIPAADISEQISTASMEASGTGNMKFMMNGALTVGTLDGANIEILDLVGKDNMFVFGLTADQVLGYYQNGGYSAHEMIEKDQRINLIMNQLYNPGLLFDSRDPFDDIYHSILNTNDQFFILKDFNDYVRIQEKIGEEYQDKKSWFKKTIINIANSGQFSSDRTIVEYADDIWGINEKYI
ncbi:glycogen/starch/alpha-glucan phosphorylase [Natronospora cellulosivora (SeqCode)]